MSAQRWEPAPIGTRFDGWITEVDALAYASTGISRTDVVRICLRAWDKARYDSASRQAVWQVVSGGSTATRAAVEFGLDRLALKATIAARTAHGWKVARKLGFSRASFQQIAKDDLVPARMVRIV